MHKSAHQFEFKRVQINLVIVQLLVLPTPEKQEITRPFLVMLEGRAMTG